MCTPSCSLHQSPHRLGARILRLSKRTHNPKTCAPSHSTRRAQIAWEYAIWDFQGPTFPKCVLPAAPSIKAHIAWEHASCDFQKGPTIPKPVLQATPLAEPRSLGSTQFGTFKVPHSQNVYSQLLPPSKPTSLGSTHLATFKKDPQSQNLCSKPLHSQSPDRLGVRNLGRPRAPNPKMCTPSCSLHQSPHRLGARILRLSKRTHNPKTCAPSHSTRRAQIAWEYAIWDDQGPQIPKCVLPAAPPIRAYIAWEYTSCDFL